MVDSEVVVSFVALALSIVTFLLVTCGWLVHLLHNECKRRQEIRDNQLSLPSITSPHIKQLPMVRTVDANNMSFESISIS